MHALHDRVASIQEILVGIVAMQHRAVVADAEDHGALRRTEDAPQLANQTEFAEILNAFFLFSSGFHERPRTYSSMAMLVTLNRACIVIGASREPVNS